MNLKYLTLNSASKYLSFSPKTLYRWVEERKIPAYKVGRVWRFDREELDQFMQKFKQKVNYNTDCAVGSEREEV